MKKWSVCWVGLILTETKKKMEMNFSNRLIYLHILVQCQVDELTNWKCRRRRNVFEQNFLLVAHFVSGKPLCPALHNIKMRVSSKKSFTLLKNLHIIDFLLSGLNNWRWSNNRLSLLKVLQVSVNRRECHHNQQKTREKTTIYVKLLKFTPVMLCDIFGSFFFLFSVTFFVFCPLFPYISLSLLLAQVCPSPPPPPPPPCTPHSVSFSEANDRSTLNIFGFGLKGCCSVFWIVVISISAVSL